jgi:tape measure domain-containing protein
MDLRRRWLGSGATSHLHIRHLALVLGAVVVAATLAAEPSDGSGSTRSRMAAARPVLSSTIASTTSRIRTGFSGAFGAASAGAGELRGQIRGLAQMGTVIAAGLGFVNLASDIYQVSTGAQHTEAVLEGLYETAGHGASEASVMMGLLNDRFSRSGIAMQAFQQGASDLAYLGLTAHETANLMQFMESTISATGGSAEELGRVTTALASAQNAGRASAAELNQISQAGVPIYDMLADHLGITNAEIRDLTGSGTLLVEDVLEAMQAQGGTWAAGLIDGAERANRTWSSAWDSMRNTFVNGVANELVPLLDRVSPVVHRMADGVGNAFDRLPGMVSRVGQAMRDSGVLDALRSIGEGILNLARGAGPALVGFAIRAGVALGGLVLALEPLGVLLGQLGEWMQNNSQVVAVFGLVVGALATAWFTVIKPILAVVEAFKAGCAAIALLSNAFGWVIAAIALLAAGLVYAWKNSERFREIVTGAWEWVKSAVAGVVSWFTGTAWPAIKDWWNNLTSSASAASGDWAQAWESIKDIFVSVWEIISAFWDDHGQGIITGLKAIAALARVIWSALWTSLGGILSGAWQIIAGLFSGALQIISGILDVFIGLFTGDWQRMWDGIVSIGKGLWDAAVAIFLGLVTAIGGILKGLWEIVKTIFMGIYNWLVGNSIIPDLVEAIVAWFKKLSDWLKGILTGIASFIRTIWSGIATAVRTAVTVVVTVIRTAFQVMQTVIRTVLSVIRAVITGDWGAIRGIVSNAVSSIRSAISNGWNTVRTLTTNAWSSIVSAVSSRVSNLISRVRQIPSQARSALSNIGSMMRTVGTNLVTGIINGVTGAAGRLYSSLRNMARNALNSAKNALGISSPSRVFRDEVGSEIIAGLLGGIDAGQGQVDRALADLVSARPVLGRVQVPVSAEVSRHAAAQQQRAVSQQRDLVRAEERSAAAMRDLVAALRARDDGDFVLQVDSKEIARANRRGEHGLARR